MHESSIPGGKSGHWDKQTTSGTIQGNPGRLASMGSSAEMYTNNVGPGRTVLEHGVVTSYLDGFTLPTTSNVHLHRYALQIRYHIYNNIL